MQRQPTAPLDARHPYFPSCGRRLPPWSTQRPEASDLITWVTSSKSFRFQRELNPNASLQLATSPRDRPPTTSYHIHNPALCSSPVAIPQTSQLIPAPGPLCVIPSAWKALPPDFQMANTCLSAGASSTVTFFVRVSWPPNELPRSLSPHFIFSTVCITIWNIILLI